ncbi:proline iminopeptidase [Atractiella rhizophila]|nr:proline iminopeptidase [Atractiella rhizophila]
MFKWIRGTILRTSIKGFRTRTIAMGRSLYPHIEPYKTGEHHTLHVMQCGNPQGRPVIFLHGGPGGGCELTDRQRFDPSHYRIVLFDQRGCGESTPSACLEENTLWDLVKDVETIREHLQVKKWGVFGGSTFALAYAQAHPDKVAFLVLRGIFTLRKEELDFFYQGPGTSFLFPDYWESFIEVIPEEERGDMMRAYYKRLTSTDDDVRKKAAKAWSTWEMATSRLAIDPEYIARADGQDFADQFARIECHYFVNEGFMRQGQLLETQEIDKIRHIPAVIVQGRYDVVCPATTAWELHRKWPEAKFELIPDAGHSAKEEGIEKALVGATNEFRKMEY